MDKRIESVKVFLLWMTQEYPKSKLSKSDIHQMAKDTLTIFEELEENLNAHQEILKYYANPENYIPKDDLCQHEMDLDQGHRARKAIGNY